MSVLVISISDWSYDVCYTHLTCPFIPNLKEDILHCVGIFFFFKQKTAYEMRISDWSSDVCSSDLLPHRLPAAGRRRLADPRARTGIRRARRGRNRTRSRHDLGHGEIGRAHV